MTKPLTELQFEEEMRWILIRAEKECGYRAAKIVAMLVRLGAIETAKKLINDPRLQEDVVTLALKKRLDLTVEALVSREPWRGSGWFTPEELKICDQRLLEYRAPAKVT